MVRTGNATGKQQPLLKLPKQTIPITTTKQFRPCSGQEMGFIKRWFDDKLQFIAYKISFGYFVSRYNFALAIALHSRFFDFRFNWTFTKNYWFSTKLPVKKVGINRLSSDTKLDKYKVVYFKKNKRHFVEKCEGENVEYSWKYTKHKVKSRPT